MAWPHQGFTHQCLIFIHVTMIKITYYLFKWKEIRTRATDSCYQWSVESVTHAAPFARLPTRGSYSLTLRLVQVSEWICVIAPGVTFEMSPLGTPRHSLIYDSGPIHFWPQPGLCPSSRPSSRPSTDGLRDQTKKETDFDQKKKKIGRVSSNSWVRLGESQPVFQACCVLTHHCQDRDLCFSGLHPSC